MYSAKAGLINFAKAEEEKTAEDYFNLAFGSQNIAVLLRMSQNAEAATQVVNSICMGFGKISDRTQISRDIVLKSIELLNCYLFPQLNMDRIASCKTLIAEGEACEENDDVEGAIQRYSQAAKQSFDEAKRSKGSYPETTPYRRLASLYPFRVSQNKAQLEMDTQRQFMAFAIWNGLMGIQERWDHVRSVVAASIGRDFSEPMEYEKLMLNCFFLMQWESNCKQVLKSIKCMEWGNKIANSFERQLTVAEFKEKYDRLSNYQRQLLTKAFAGRNSYAERFSRMVHGLQEQGVVQIVPIVEIEAKKKAAEKTAAEAAANLPKVDSAPAALAVASLPKRKPSQSHRVAISKDEKARREKEKKDVVKFLKDMNKAAAAVASPPSAPADKKAEPKSDTKKKRSKKKKRSAEEKNKTSVAAASVASDSESSSDVEQKSQSTTAAVLKEIGHNPAVVAAVPPLLPSNTFNYPASAKTLPSPELMTNLKTLAEKITLCETEAKTNIYLYGESVLDLLADDEKSIERYSLVTDMDYQRLKPVMEKQGLVLAPPHKHDQGKYFCELKGSGIQKPMTVCLHPGITFEQNAATLNFRVDALYGKFQAKADKKAFVKFIDVRNGLKDYEQKLLQFVIRPLESIQQDPIRLLQLPYLAAKRGYHYPEGYKDLISKADLKKILANAGQYHFILQKILGLDQAVLYAGELGIIDALPDSLSIKAQLKSRYEVLVAQPRSMIMYQ